MSLVHTEHVLVVPTAEFHRLGYFQGISTDVQRYLDRLLSADIVSYRPRQEMEQDPAFNKLIPYIIFRYRDERGETRLFQYTRGTGQGSNGCTANAALVWGDTSPRKTRGSTKRPTPMPRVCGENWTRRSSCRRRTSITVWP